MNITRDTTLGDLLDHVQALGSEGDADTMFVLPTHYGERKVAIAVGMGEAGELLVRLVHHLLKTKGVSLDPRSSGPAAHALDDV